jgi:hypothetical protein
MGDMEVFFFSYLLLRASCGMENENEGGWQQVSSTA